LIGFDLIVIDNSLLVGKVVVERKPQALEHFKASENIGYLGTIECFNNITTKKSISNDMNSSLLKRFGYWGPIGRLVIVCRYVLLSIDDFEVIVNPLYIEAIKTSV